ncbi:UDP-2,3-diacylglucosamine diphosphatase [Maribacter polysiphoniae]|uniref:UDP-2,3-diacylglucosamine diphosphatase n=1 Tax=Maribacter polysiphoniae TaxID=429344 RepID=A0A316EIY3_9FLAO|nr:UDP-2,3-diacylglucosamine diphosphatase [Maribacter polysiphoniae]MBD1261573.1 UDP-2,3-diacylglucosamine diphosphatase [Maribacter polysiphoniae]PWK22910.1 UDP-2,3-diacylglucosamine pyrophosphatase LpxH [Maribacter polysiphoniae]
MKKRPVDVVVISDVHLGTYGCHAKELLKYLKSITPNQVILNGDIVDIWQFSKHYWPKSHMKIVKLLLEWVAKGVKVQYITGNHDEMLRKFAGFRMGSFSIANKVLLNVHGKKAWIFHGDVFDVTMQHSKWIAKLGAMGYDFLILLNSAVNLMSKKMGKKPISMSKKIKNGVKSAIKFISDFEQTAADIAIEKEFDYVICGHIHQPVIRKVNTSKGSVMYLNSGDWVENLTALEYSHGKWELYSYDNDIAIHSRDMEVFEPTELLEKNELFDRLMLEFQTISVSSGNVKTK